MGHEKMNGRDLLAAIVAAYETLSGAPDERVNVVKLNAEDAKQVTRVLLNSEELPQFNTQAEFDASPSGWYNAGNFLILAKPESASVTEKKVFEFLKITP